MTLAERSRRELEKLEGEGLRRAVPVNAGLVDFASNDYLGLASAAPLLAALREAPRVGSSGSRLLSGAHPEHTVLERELATFVRRERALLFSSGYLAALGAIHGLARIARVAYSDELNHACVIDGLRLTRMERHVFPHRELPPPEERSGPAVIVTESLFGMTGELTDPGAILPRLHPDDVLVVDEAHALGVFGPSGAGAASVYDDERIVVLGTLSKAFGCVGGFVAGPAPFIELLISTARSFIFDTSLPPPIVRAARAALDRIAQGDDLRERLFENLAQVGTALELIGRSGPIRTPIVPVVIGEAHEALAVATRLRAAGLYVPAVRPPTVPQGTSRLRITVRADHTPSEIERLGRALAQAFPQVPA